MVFNREPFDRNEDPTSFVPTQSIFSRDDGALIRDYMTRSKENESPSSDFHARSSSHLEDPRWFLIHFAYTEMYSSIRGVLIVIIRQSQRRRFFAETVLSVMSNYSNIFNI